MLSEPTYFILASLLDGPLHGYAILKAAEELSGGRVRITAGTLYGGLDRLLGQGLVSFEGEEIVNGRARRYYSVTGEGIAALRRDASHKRSAAAVVSRRLGRGSRIPGPA